MSSRKEQLLLFKGIHRSSSELSLALEGKYTNLRIWVSLPCAPVEATEDTENVIYMRLDKSANYSITIVDNYAIAAKARELVDKLGTFGFPAPINKLDEILSIVQHLKVRECNPW